MCKSICENTGSQKRIKCPSIERCGPRLRFRLPDYVALNQGLANIEHMRKATHGAAQNQRTMYSRQLSSSALPSTVMAKVVAVQTKLASENQLHAAIYPEQKAASSQSGRSRLARRCCLSARAG
jgi:hypothetical protein